MENGVIFLCLIKLGVLLSVMVFIWANYVMFVRKHLKNTIMAIGVMRKKLKELVFLKLLEKGLNLRKGIKEGRTKNKY